MINERMKNLLDEACNALRLMFGNNLHDVLLYGSYARGDYDSESDVDILALVNLPKEDISKLQRKVSDMSSDLDPEYDVIFSILLQDTETYNQYQKDMPFFRNISKEGISLVH